MRREIIVTPQISMTNRHQQELITVVEEEALAAHS